MKKLISISVLLFTMISIFNVNAIEPKTTVVVDKKAKVEVYYFHYSRRCATCQAVETQSQKIVKELYAKQYKDGQIKFVGVNLDDEGSEVLAEKCKVEGQALLVMSGKKRVDLTKEGFMYARTKPEKLKQELKKVIDPLLK